MIKRIRTALVALLVAFAIAFGLGPLDGFFGTNSTPSVLVGIKLPPPALTFLNDPTGLPLRP